MGKPISSTHIVFLLVPKFSLISFATAIEPLRLANRFLEYKAYRWHVISCDGTPVHASNGLETNVSGSIADVSASRLDIDRPHFVFVCSGVEVEKVRHRDLNGFLRRMHRQGTAIGGICTAAWILARAGLLEDKRCSIHWENLPAFSEAFRDVDVRANLFEIDDNIYTCAGGTAPLDMMLHLLRLEHGETMVTKVCEQVLTDRVREATSRQRLPLRARLGVHNSKLLFLIELMEANIATPIDLDKISKHAGLSRRHVERLFQAHLGRSPARYYLDLRLDTARHLLLQSDMPIVDVAVACGFVSASHFSKCFRALYGQSPQTARRQSTLVETN